MATNTIEVTILDQLETLIDRHGLSAVIVTLAHICRLKADHVRDTRPDNQVARPWDSAARKLERVKVEV